VKQSVKKFIPCPRICPVEAVRVFLSVATSLRGNTSFLFVSSNGLCASKDTLQRWVRDELLLAGIKASAGSCRSASTSLAFEKSVPINIIMSSAGWSLENTFRQFYQREVV
jgi:hypothetical protein